MTEDKKPHDLYDRGYKMMLSFTKLFQQLVDGFVDQEWKVQLDYSRSERIDKTFIQDKLEKEEADILYKVPFKKMGGEIYLYILIEQQSTVDYSLNFRVLEYLVAILKTYYKNADQNVRKQKGFQFPPVFAIVLYNGVGSWTANTSFRDSVAEADKFGDFVPNVKYHLLDIPRYDPQELKKMGNTLAGVFLLEREVKDQDVESFLKDGLSIIGKEQDYEIWKQVIYWLLAKLDRELPDEARSVLAQIDLERQTKQEVTTMLETVPRRILAKGQQEGMRASIVDVLEARFGFISVEIIDGIGKISDLKALHTLVRKASTVASIVEFQDALEKVGKQS